MIIRIPRRFYDFHEAAGGRVPPILSTAPRSYQIDDDHENFMVLLAYANYFADREWTADMSSVRWAAQALCRAVERAQKISTNVR